VCLDVQNPPQWTFTKIISRDQTACVAVSKQTRRKKEKLKKKKREKKKGREKIISVLAADPRYIHRIEMQVPCVCSV